MIHRELSGWGRWPRQICRIEAPADAAGLSALLKGKSTAIARGLGRSYGDSALNPELVVDLRRLNRMMAFDADTGVLEAEAGVPLADVIAAFLPRGFFPMVTPGTKFVTLGGAIAADVHGKNHHVDGSFGDHVLWFDLLGPDQVIRRCSPSENAELFGLTFGAMGLTGIIIRAAIRLRRIETGYIRQRRIVARDLDAAISTFEANGASTYSVAWIDCLASGSARGRSIVYLGEHADIEDLTPARQWAPFKTRSRRRKTVPIDAPAFALNRLTVSAFNALYFHANARRPETALVDWDSYFYPLDALNGWNRIYGKRGFAQYQCVLPLDTARNALAEQLDVISTAGQGSFLAVLKRLGKAAAQRPFSFPMEGYTLALDFPMNAAALKLMDRLDAITAAAGGRLYLAKDSRMSPDMFRAGYHDAADRLAGLGNGNPAVPRMASLQSRRLGL